MFGFDRTEDGSEQRFHARINKFKQDNKPTSKHHVWWFVHNCIAHPLIGVAPSKPTFDFHDWTSHRIQGEPIDWHPLKSRFMSFIEDNVPPEIYGRFSLHDQERKLNRWGDKSQGIFERSIYNTGNTVAAVISVKRNSKNHYTWWVAAKSGGSAYKTGENISADEAKAECDYWLNRLGFVL